MPCETPKAQMPSRTIRSTIHGPPSNPVPVFVSLLLDNDSRETLGVLDVDSLNVAVELLLGTLLVVTSPGDADAKSVWDTLDTLLPDLLVELGVDTDIGSTLWSGQHTGRSRSKNLPSAAIVQSSGPASKRTIDLVAKALISLMALGALFLKLTPCSWSSRQ